MRYYRRIKRNPPETIPSYISGKMGMSLDKIKKLIISINKHD
jgi:hypothetical protein|tara:strand:+ start:54 stop:179 length:126 start_codon:yes stop_codon:yes gene_type:complete